MSSTGTSSSCMRLRSRVSSSSLSRRGFLDEEDIAKGWDRTKVSLN
jgi:hypothetical protein